MERRCRADGFAGKPLIFLLLSLVCLTRAFCEFTGALVYTGRALPLDFESMGNVAGGVGGQSLPPGCCSGRSQEAAPWAARGRSSIQGCCLLAQVRAALGAPWEPQNGWM